MITNERRFPSSGDDYYDGQREGRQQAIDRLVALRPRLVVVNQATGELEKIWVNGTELAQLIKELEQ